MSRGTGSLRSRVLASNLNAVLLARDRVPSYESGRHAGRVHHNDLNELPAIVDDVVLGFPDSKPLTSGNSPVHPNEFVFSAYEMQEVIRR